MPSVHADVQDRVTLGVDEIHVWRVPLVSDEDHHERCGALLSPDELRRSDRLVNSDHRMEFVVAHGALRMILSRYVIIAGAHIEFGANAYGRPFVANSSGERQVYFSLSHTAGLALVAVAGTESIGVDIEKIRPVSNLELLSEMYFSPVEAGKLRQVEGAEQLQAFFRCWTRKEAFVKAIGAGLSLDLSKFEVTLLPHEDPAVAHCRWNPSEASKWRMAELIPGEHYVGALAVRAPDLKLSRFDWICDG